MPVAATTTSLSLGGVSLAAWGWPQRDAWVCRGPGNPPCVRCVHRLASRWARRRGTLVSSLLVLGSNTARVVRFGRTRGRSTTTLSLSLFFLCFFFSFLLSEFFFFFFLGLQIFLYIGEGAKCIYEMVRLSLPLSRARRERILDGPWLTSVTRKHATRGRDVNVNVT